MKKGSIYGMSLHVVMLLQMVIFTNIFDLFQLGFFKRKHQEEIAARKKSQNAEPKSDEENLIQNNSKDQEKEPIEDNMEEAKAEVSPDKCDELDKMLQEVQNYA